MSDKTSMGTIEAERVAEAVGVSIEADPAKRSELQQRMVRTWDGVRQWRHGLCKVCAAPFEDVPMEWEGLSLTATVCEACGPLVTAHYTPGTEAKDVTMTPWWDEHCPAVYRDLISGHALPTAVNRRAYDRVQGFTASTDKGMVLVGPSGSGKTLALWAKARDLEKSGVRPVFLSAVEFARRLASSARDLERANWLASCRVLIVDDVGKEKLTNAVASLMWEVLDARVNERRPTLISTRFKGTGFVERFTDAVIGEDIRGRISDSCGVDNVVQFATG
jgi:hypothetical protein